MKITPEYFDLAGASDYTGGGLSIRTLRRLIAMPGGLPYHQAHRGKIIIRRADLDGWLAKHRYEPLDLDTLADQAVKELRAGP